MAQVGILSLSQLQAHDHYGPNAGGPILVVTRVASAAARISSPAPQTTPAGVGTWARLKQIILLEDSPGTCDITFTLTRAGGAGNVHGQVRIYRAGSAIFTGTDNSTAAGPTDYTDAAVATSWLAYDTIEVWGYVSAGATTICYVDGLDVLFDTTITSLSRRTISIACTGVSIPYTAVS